MKKFHYYHLNLEKYKKYPVILKTDKSCYEEISNLVLNYENENCKKEYIGLIDYIYVGLYKLGISCEELPLSTIGD